MVKSDFYSEKELAEIKNKLNMGYLMPLEVRGNNMQPMLKEGRDKVILFKLFFAPEKGRIVLYKGDSNNYFLSRVYHSDKDKCTLSADKSFDFLQISTADCIAEVKAIERNGKQIKNGFIWWYFEFVSVLLKEFSYYILSLFKFKKKKNKPKN